MKILDPRKRYNILRQEGEEYVVEFLHLSTLPEGFTLLPQKGKKGG